MRYCLTALATFVLALLVPQSAGAQSFWNNGSFAYPRPGVGSFVLMDTGERTGGWRVVGEAGNVALVSGKYIHHGFDFLAPGSGGPHPSDTWVNLAGLSQSKTGIAHQPVATNIGSNYTLTFYVGNLYDPDGVYGTQSTVLVYENSKLLGKYTNDGGAGTQDENWKMFTVTFPADASYTTIAFINGDRVGDMNCGLGDTNFTPATHDAESEHSR